jgi:Circadian oscillating protein COP23
MKQQLFGQVLTELMKTSAVASLTAFATTAIIQQPSYAGGTTFYCGKSKDVPITYARTQDGKNVPLVRWASNNYFPPPWTAQRRCSEVSRRFQKNYDNGTLKNIKTGTIRGEAVVCAAIKSGSPCTDSTLLFTLKRGANPSATVRSLLDRRGLAAGNALNESGGDTINIDFDAYLNNITNEPNGESTPQPSNSTSEASQNPWWEQK